MLTVMIKAVAVVQETCDDALLRFFIDTLIIAALCHICEFL